MAAVIPAPIVCQGCWAEVIPGDRWTAAHEAAWSAEHAGHRPARSLADEVRETLRSVDGVRFVRPTTIGNEARVEARSTEAALAARRVLVAAGWDVTEIGYVTIARRKGGAS